MGRTLFMVSKLFNSIHFTLSQPQKLREINKPGIVIPNLGMRKLSLKKVMRLTNAK